ncbi:MAG: PAS domain S-box protein, partial [Syntrophales bacterium]|nr:PAS domain S-box protein [Syntrophales bacterium]
DHVLLLDKDMKILWSNSSLQSYFRKQPHKLMGTYCYESLYSRSRPCTSCPSFEAIKTGKPHDYERVDSSGRSWTFRGYPVCDSNGHVIGAVEIVTDITERKRSEEALRQSEERYRNIIENMDDGYFESDLTGKFTYVNEAMIEIYGYSREELLHMNYREYTSHAEAKRIFMAYKELHRTGIPVKIFDYEIMRKDGEIRHLEVSTTLVYNTDGRPIGFRGIDRDVTERKKMEEEKKKLTQQLHQAQKMEAIGTLAGGIAHDFNNLLMGIQGYASLILLDLDKNYIHYDKLKAIETQVQSGADLTRQLLGFARGGRYEVKLTDINALISKTATMFGRTKKEIRIHERFFDDLWTVETDRGQMEQVFLNLFVNSWQAMPGGGSLYLETQNIILDKVYLKPYDVAPGPYVKISVTDTGVGMDENTIQRIFDPFFTTKEMGRGTGLGLASAYGIIKGHGGIINVYSEKGHGSTFNIYLPASKKELIVQEQDVYELVRGQETLLIVDDEKIIREVTGAMLEGLGYHVLTANSGEEAVDVYRSSHDEIDLVIMDMIMPGIGGGGAFDAIRAINPEAKVILSSGYSMNGMAKDILERGVRAFLQKPFRLDDISRKIREVLATNR